MNKSTKAHATACSILSIILLVPAIGAWDSWSALPKHVDVIEAPVTIPTVEVPHTVTLPQYVELDTVTIVGNKKISPRVTEKQLEWSCVQRQEGIQRIDDHGNIVRIDPIKICEWK